MNYGKHETEKKIKSVNSKAKKYTSRVFLAFLKSLFVLCLFCLVVAGSIGFGMVKGMLLTSISQPLFQTNTPLRCMTVPAM